METSRKRHCQLKELVHVVTYNVLNPFYATEADYPHNAPKDLEDRIRLTRVLNKLGVHVTRRAIICLQEVALSWAGPLHSYFARQRFHLVLGTYGSRDSGYMGVALAFPTDRFVPDEIRIEVLADMVDWPVFSTRHTARARARRNILVFARLRTRCGTSLYVGTYHMPCAYRTPPVMHIHAALVVSVFQRLSRGYPGVLAGDFNIKPHDMIYRMIVGEICFWSPHRELDSRFSPMKSAYKELHGTEPDFTNYARRDEGRAFCDTLDYVFCSPGLDIVDVVPVLDRKHVPCPLPSSNEPSDHILIGATVAMPSRKNRFARIPRRSANRRHRSIRCHYHLMTRFARIRRQSARRRRFVIRPNLYLTHVRNIETDNNLGPSLL